MRTKLLAIITAILVLGCGLFNSESDLEKYNPDRYKSPSVEAPFELNINYEEITSVNSRLEIRITNNTSEKIGLIMGGGSENYLFREFFITTLDTNIVWRSYNSNIYALAESRVILDSSETIALDQEWGLVNNEGNRIKSGDYLLFAGLTGVYQEEVIELEDTTIIGGDILRDFGDVGVGRNPIIISID